MLKEFQNSALMKEILPCLLVKIFHSKKLWMLCNYRIVVSQNYQSTIKICEIIIYEVPSISFPTFFVWTLLLIVHTWNSSPLLSNLLRLQCTYCTVPTTSRRLHRSPLVWAYQWPSSLPLSSPQLSHNGSLWA